jgi:transforming growth factor-beta-induced protein
MKQTRKVFLSILMGLVLLVSVPVYAQEQSIVDIAAGSEDFSILVAALQQANLVEALQGEGPFTVFAPTNEAFTKLLGELQITADDLLNHPQLADVLLYHVVSGKILSTDLQDGAMPETLGGQTVKVDLKDGAKINESKVVTADIEATNGVIHVIDTVLVPETFTLTPAAELPATVVDIALSSPDFSILVAAVQQAGLVEALQGEGPFTVFAPTNAAFEKLLGVLSISAEDLLNNPQLADVLLYHVVAGKVLSTDLQNGMEADTLGGQKIAIDLTDGVRINESSVTAADLEAGNGVVHVIDTVLVPETFTLN